MFTSLFDIARLRARARDLGITEIVGQGRKLRVGKINPPESVRMRIERIYKGAQYRPLTETYTIPTPFEGSLGSAPMDSDGVIRWVGQLLDDLAWTPKPRS